MAYESVDELQKILTEEVFDYATDSKKAAGRALGTIVEIVTFYLLKSWGLDSSISIETKVPEYGRPEITHNVEYSLHPVLAEQEAEINGRNRSLTAHRLLQLYDTTDDKEAYSRTTHNLLSRDGVLRNGCRIAESQNSILTATLMEEGSGGTFLVSIAKQSRKPYALFECKRVGVEEGNKRGPQTIEKAKQGAYVARTVSSLQKVRVETGRLYGVIFQEGSVLRSGPYQDLLACVIESNDSQLLSSFVLTIGVVSNHGNWFTSQDHNKELKVLAQSYDWLLFLTDKGITEFISEVIIDPVSKYGGIRNAFMESYRPEKTKNRFTKLSISLNAHRQLLDYFANNTERIEGWFEVIAPVGENPERLKRLVQTLRNKEWAEIHK